jgi:hypothetical protein
VCFDKYLRTARSASSLLRLAGFEFGRCESADPAADFESLELLPFRNTLEADFAALSLVCLTIRPVRLPLPAPI